MCKCAHTKTKEYADSNTFTRLS